MESPQMYDLSDAVVKPNLLSLSSKVGKLGGPYGEEFGDLADLGASEVSLDLQAFVNDPHFSDGIFPDIVDKSLGVGLGSRAGPPATCSSGLAYSSGGYLPPAQPVCSVGPRLAGAPSQIPPVKKDPDGSEFQAYRQPAAYPGINAYSPAYTSLTPSSSRPAPVSPALARPSSKSSSGSGGGGGGGGGGGSKRVDRSSDEYRRRRERNNVAVRRSREKAKVRSRETEERVKLLARENDGLHKRIESLSKELGVLKNLFANVGVLPDQLHREIAKHLGDGFNRGQPPSGL